MAKFTIILMRPTWSDDDDQGYFHGSFPNTNVEPFTAHVEADDQKAAIKAARDQCRKADGNRVRNAECLPLVILEGHAKLVGL